MTEALNRYDQEDRDYIDETLDLLRQEPNICNQNPAQNIFQIQDTIENLKLGGPWDAYVEIEQGVITNKEYVELLWSTIVGAYGSYDAVPASVAIRLTNHCHNPQDLIKTIINSHIEHYSPQEKLSMLLELSICCMKEPLIENWVREEITSLAYIGLIEDPDNSEDQNIELWQVETDSAKNIIENNTAYSLIFQLLAINESTSEANIKEHISKTENIVNSVNTNLNVAEIIITPDKLIEYTNEIYSQEKQNIKGLDRQTKIDYLVGILEDRVRCLASEDMLDTAVETVLNNLEQLDK